MISLEALSSNSRGEQFKGGGSGFDLAGFFFFLPVIKRRRAISIHYSSSPDHFNPIDVKMFNMYDMKMSLCLYVRSPVPLQC